MPRWFLPALAVGLIVLSALCGIGFVIYRLSARAEVKLAADRKPPADPRAAAYKKLMRAFIEEGKSLANIMELNPTPSEHRAKVFAAKEAFSRVPDPPTPGLKKLHEGARLLVLLFEADDALLAMLHKGVDDHGLDSVRKQWKDDGPRRKAALAELEKLLSQEPD